MELHCSDRYVYPPGFAAMDTEREYRLVMAVGRVLDELAERVPGARGWTLQEQLRTAERLYRADCWRRRYLRRVRPKYRWRRAGGDR